MAKLPKTKSQSLRHPGQSLDEKIDRVVLDDFMGYYLFAAGLWLLAIVEWLAKLFHYPRLPVAYAVAATAATALCAVKFIRTKREVRNLRQGRDGEREVAEILDELKRHGAEVLHDIPEVPRRGRLPRLVRETKARRARRRYLGAGSKGTRRLDSQGT